MATILIIEDEAILSHQLRAALESAGHETRVAPTALAGLEAVRIEVPDFVLLDLRLPDRSGLDLIPELLGLDPDLLVVLMSAYGSEVDATEAVKRGAAAYLNKPLDLGELSLKIGQLLDQKQGDLERAHLRQREQRQSAALVAADPSLASLAKEIGRLCDRGSPARQRPPIVLHGEPGSGRRALAHALHVHAGGGAFIDVRSEGSTSEELAERVFGTVREGGTRAGLVDAARGGALFFEDIGALDVDLQARLVELLKTKRARRVGSDRERECDVHVLAAATSDLEEAHKRGDFDGALLDRFRGLVFHVPPLRDRLDEAVEIASHLAAELGRDRHVGSVTLGDDAKRLVRDYDWPGNLGELRAAVERALLLRSGSELGAALFAGTCGPSGRAEPGSILLPQDGVQLADLEQDLIRQALGRTGGNLTRAATLLGLSRDTLRYRVAKWKLEAETR